MKFLKSIFFIVLFLPFMSEIYFQYFPFIPQKELNGSFVNTPHPALTAYNWMSGLYQDSLMQYYEQNMSIHKSLILLNNQINYSLFGEINEKDVVEGKDGMLFANSYIVAYYGNDFTGDAKINDWVTKLKYVQDELKKRNIDLLFVICCGKPAYYPEFIPENWKDSVRKKTNYQGYAEAFEKQKINYIDTRRLLLQLKSKTNYPLFTKTGVHWSTYAATLMADTVLKRMEQMHQMDMPDYSYCSGEWSDTARLTDNDISKGMNLMFPLPSGKLFYPKICWVKDDTKFRPNVLISGDSFVDSWYQSLEYIPNMFSKKTNWWYYTNTVMFSETENSGMWLVDELNLKAEVLQRDFILIVYNDINLVNGDYGFTEKLYDMLKAEEKNGSK